MSTYARGLFSVAAIFNFAMAAAILFARPALSAMLGLDAVTGTDLVFVYISAIMIACFGYAYVCVAYDARRFRVYIPLAVIGKLLVVGAACWLWVSGVVPAQLPRLASGDLVFAVLFVDYLRRTRMEALTA